LSFGLTTVVVVVGPRSARLVNFSPENVNENDNRAIDSSSVVAVGVAWICNRRPSARFSISRDDPKCSMIVARKSKHLKTTSSPWARRLYYAGTTLTNANRKRNIIILVGRKRRAVVNSAGSKTTPSADFVARRRKCTEKIVLRPITFDPGGRQYNTTIIYYHEGQYYTAASLFTRAFIFVVTIAAAAFIVLYTFGTIFLVPFSE